nr:transforming acidic coiled-coil-containing protein 3 [Nothobranchius furzeri]XP_054597584.1 transforming acidic coiled-coil-containing protein 3 [Nothobranchius furzeri]
MNSVDINDENCGVIPAGKHNDSSLDVFALEQPTGRQSILRQTENLPNRTVPKGAKVCFQTPRRDPLTKRILSPRKSVNMLSVDENNKATVSLDLDKPDTLTQEQIEPPSQEISSYPDDNMPIQSKGGYQLDFDNLDAINPFQSSNKMAVTPGRPAVETLTDDPKPQQHTSPENIQNKPTDMTPALDDTLPFTPSVENSYADVSTNMSSTDSSVVTVTVKVPVEEGPCTDTPDEKQPASLSDQEKASGSFVEDSPLPVKGAYNMDFDNLDEINPFQTGGSKIPNSPDLERKVPNSNPPTEEKISMGVFEVPMVAQESPAQDVKSISTVNPTPADAAKPPAAESEPADPPVNEHSVKLEFSFGDCSEVKRKPPPKRFGKRPSVVKPKDEKSTSDVKASAEAPMKPVSDVTDDPVPKGSYSLDLDDPYFNPFGAKARITNSPKGSGQPAVVLKEADLPEQTDKKEDGSSQSSGESLPTAEPNHEDIADHKVTSAHDQEIPLESDDPVQNAPEPPQPDQQLQMDTEFSEEFVPGTMFVAGGFDGQIDYLEQFGSSSFKESALRKQSLYLKFDPLLRESPKKSAGPSAQTHVAVPAALASQLQIPQVTEKETTKAPIKDSLKLFEDATAPAPIFGSIIPPFPQPGNSEDVIIEMLKYSQKDMDAAIAKVQAEGREKEEQWSCKCKKLQDDGQEMRKILAEYELVIAKMMADQEKEKELAEAKLKETLLEKEQVSNDLNSMEKYCAELFKRLEKYKDVVEGYKKNEETLKACAQDYLARINKEEQRYQALKAHAEEKITKANTEIAEVRFNYKAELSVLQAKLRREQLKLQSVERSLEQKEKEAEELTKLCDELISKVQRG